jgi:phosphotransferase system  glucose/maltose/N-acetylglucosamine-specific IIC component
MSRSGLLTLLILALIITSLFSCLNVSVGALGVQGTIRYLNSAPNIPQEEIDMLKQSIPYAINEATRYLVIGYSSYIIAFIISRIIQKRMDITTEKNAANRWKFNK